MSITEYSVRHSVAVLVLCAGLMLLGTLAYFRMPRESFPDVKFPFIIVTTTLEGANPTDVEKSVTVPLETELDGLEGAKEMRSVSSEGLSMISIEFDPDVDTQVALTRVRDAVDQAKPELPSEAEEPTVKEFTITSVPVLIYHLVGNDRVAISELYEMADKIEDELKQLPGVLDIDIYGGRDRQVVIEVDPERLAFYHLQLAQA